ncbi:hypothetical protein D3C80_487760 [compost metagenome]
MQAQQQKVDVLPRWMTKAKLQIIQQMTPEEALSELEKLRNEWISKRREYNRQNRGKRAQAQREWALKNRAKKRAADRAWKSKIKAEDPDRYKQMLDRMYASRRAKNYKAVRKSPRPPEQVREHSRDYYWRKKAQNLATKNPQDIRKAIRAKLPGYLTEAARMDVANTVLQGMLSRHIRYDELHFHIKKAVTEYNRQFDYFKTVSIDAPIAGTDGLTRGDMLSNDTPHF